MRRGDVFRVKKPGGGDPRKQRVFVVVSRQTLVDSQYSTVICAPVFSRFDGLSTQVLVSVEIGLKHDSSIHCDQLLSLPKAALTNFIGRLSNDQLIKLERALAIAVGLSLGL